MLDASTFFTVLENLGTILGRSWDNREYKKGHCEVQAWILFDFWLIYDTTQVERLLGTFGLKILIFHIYFQVAFSDDFLV
jgi:hypothetical protein